jgi:hypothetical protein
MKKLAQTNPEGPLLIIAFFLEDIDMISWMVSRISNLLLISSSILKKKFRSKKALSLWLDLQELEISQKLEKVNMKIILECLIESKCVNIEILDNRLLRMCTKYDFFDLAEKVMNNINYVDVTIWKYTCFFHSIRNSNLRLFSFLWHHLTKNPPRDVLKDLVDEIIKFKREKILLFLLKKCHLIHLMEFRTYLYDVTGTLKEFIEKLVKLKFDNVLKYLFTEYMLKHSFIIELYELTCDWICKMDNCLELYKSIEDNYKIVKNRIFNEGDKRRMVKSCIRNHCMSIFEFINLRAPVENDLFKLCVESNNIKAYRILVSRNRSHGVEPFFEIKKLKNFLLTILKHRNELFFKLVFNTLCIGIKFGKSFEELIDTLFKNKMNELLIMIFESGNFSKEIINKFSFECARLGRLDILRILFPKVSSDICKYDVIVELSKYSTKERVFQFISKLDCYDFISYDNYQIMKNFRYDYKIFEFLFGKIEKFDLDVYAMLCSLEKTKFIEKLESEWLLEDKDIFKNLEKCVGDIKLVDVFKRLLVNAKNKKIDLSGKYNFLVLYTIARGHPVFVNLLFGSPCINLSIGTKGIRDVLVEETFYNELIYLYEKQKFFVDKSLFIEVLKFDVLKKVHDNVSEFMVHSKFFLDNCNVISSYFEIREILLKLLNDHPNLFVHLLKKTGIKDISCNNNELLKKISNSQKNVTKYLIDNYTVDCSRKDWELLIFAIFNQNDTLFEKILSFDDVNLFTKANEAFSRALCNKRFDYLRKMFLHKNFKKGPEEDRKNISLTTMEHEIRSGLNNKKVINDYNEMEVLDAVISISEKEINYYDCEK